jgi:hypothetical protein
MKGDTRTTESSDELLSSKILVDNYNKLNMIVNDTLYPWDLREKVIEQHFIPTYKNITLYYKDTTNLLKPPIKPGMKKKKGGNVKSLVFYF